MKGPINPNPINSRNAEEKKEKIGKVAFFSVHLVKKLLPLCIGLSLPYRRILKIHSYLTSKKNF